MILRPVEGRILNIHNTTILHNARKRECHWQMVHCFGGLCIGTGPSREPHRFWSQICRVQLPSLPLPSCVPTMLLNFSVSVSSYAKQDNKRTHSAELSRMRVNTYKGPRTRVHAEIPQTIFFFNYSEKTPTIPCS